MGAAVATNSAPVLGEPHQLKTPTEMVREPATTGSGFEPRALALTRSNRGLRH